MSSPLNATVKSATANAYLTVAKADRIMRRRLYTTKWDAAGSTPDADGFLVNGSVTTGATTIPVDGGTGTFTANSVVTFAGHATEYTVSTTLTGPGNLVLSSGLTSALADDEAVSRETASEKERAIMWATQILDFMMIWFGSKRTNEQALWFPAVGLLDENGDFYDFDTIPAILEVGTVELANHLLNSNVFRLPTALGQGVSDVQLGPLRAKIDAGQQQEVIPGNILSLLSTLGRLEPEAEKGTKVVPLRRV